MSGTNIRPGFADRDEDVAATVEFEERHAHHMHILGLIRDEPAWALSRILRCERLEAALGEINTHAKRLRIDQGRGLQAHIEEALRGV